MARQEVRRHEVRRHEVRRHEVRRHEVRWHEARHETRQEARQGARQGARQEGRRAGGVAQLNAAMQRGLNLAATGYEVGALTSHSYLNQETYLFFFSFT